MQLFALNEESGQQVEDDSRRPVLSAFAGRGSNPTERDGVRCIKYRETSAFSRRRTLESVECSWWPSIQYRSAAVEVKEVMDRLTRIRQAGYPKDDFFLAMVDYNSAAERAPMMAPGAYAANRDRLNQIWREWRER